MHLTLYADSQFTSPYVLSSYVALLEKELRFEMRTVNLEEREQLRAPYRELALTARVPCLKHADFYLTESSAIVEYVEEMFPAPQYRALFPADVQQRGRARQIQAWLRSDLGALRQERSTWNVFYEPTDKPLSQAAQDAADKLLAAAERLLQGPNLFGDWCIADTEFAVMLSRLVKNGDPVPEKVRAYVEHQWQRPSLQAWLKNITAASGKE
ncbi:glutathione transferase [Massilia endophytica]|uniref:glutathione transferase n=1 Tax=Massilia endophytica TaxID=2899220 RepID=UPI001E4F52E5|nr:glutathione transferase [Massilia endophytica]UGQ46447.1 glutathione transferase [Massilia endophytica]